MKKHGIYSWSLITVWCGILLASRPSHYCTILLSNDIFISQLADMIKMQMNAEELWIAVSALTTGQLSHGYSCSHNTRMHRQHMCTNPWEPVLKYTYSLTNSMIETHKPEHKFKKWIQKKDSEVCLECLGLTSIKKLIYSTDTKLVSKSAQIRPNHLDIHFRLHTIQSKKISSRITSANVLQLSHQCAVQLSGVAGICGLFHH